MKNIFFITLFLLTLSLSEGQVNTEKYRTPKDNLGFAGHVEVNANVKTGNTEKTEIGLYGRVDYKTLNTLSFLIFQGDYEWNAGNRSSDKGLIHARYTYNFTDSVKLEFFAQVNYDKKINIENRELAGAGIRYRLLNFEDGDVHVGSAFMFEHENYDIQEDDAHPEVVGVSRWSNYLSVFNNINDNVVLSSVIYYQPAFNDFGDFRILNENHLQVGISKKMSIIVSFNLRYDSKPPASIDELDTETVVGLAVNF